MNKKLLQDIKQYVNILLWPLDDLYYHEYNHALEVFERTQELCMKEGVSEEEMEMVGIAALFHDTGFVIQYDDNEYIGAAIAKNYLKSIFYPHERIPEVEKLILATSPKIPAKTLLEAIIKDADTDNLWREDFFEKWEKLKREIEVIKKIRIKDPDWMHFSLYFLKQHRFYTKTEIEERQEGKEKNIQKLKQKMFEWRKEGLFLD